MQVKNDLHKKNKIIMNEKIIKKEVLTYKIAGEDIPMGIIYRLEDGVNYTPELLRELIALNQEIIDTHKALENYIEKQLR